MKKMMLLALISLPTLASAHCPIEIPTSNGDYCAHLEWLEGEQKIQGQFEATDKMSPQLIEMGTVPPKWIYSKAQLNVWKKGDHHHQPQKIENFLIFPYMMMVNGHHHSTSYDFGWDENSQSYFLQSMAFQAMQGCWSLRWTTSNEEASMENSSPLMNVDSYQNLDDSQNAEFQTYCNLSSQPSSGHEHGHHHNHSMHQH